MNRSGLVLSKLNGAFVLANYIDLESIDADTAGIEWLLERR